MRSLGLTLSSLLFASNPALAFDVFPEFAGWDAVEAAELDRPAALDSEYQSDVLAYMPSLAEDTAFFSRDAAFDLRLGSLSTKRFLHYERLRARRSLGEKLEFRFTRFTQKDMEEDEDGNWLELVYRLHERVGLSFYGGVSREKEDVDLGAALLFWPWKNLEVRLFHTWVDPEREERSQAGDRFVSGANPNSTGLSVRGFGDQSRFAHAGFRRDLPGVWRFPATSTDVSHDRLTIWLEGTARTSERLGLEARLQWDEKNEARSAVAPATAAAQSLARERWQALVSLTVSPPERSFTVRPGVAYIQREWRDGSGAAGRQRNTLPHLTISLPGPERSGDHDRIELGYEATFFNGDGDGRFFNRGFAYDAVEQRINARYEFALADQAKLAFLISADADAGLTFEGGHGRFLVFF